MKNYLAFFGTSIGMVILCLAIVTPVLFIWATNTLFDAGIDYTLKSWAAALLFLLLVRGGRG